MFNDVYKWLAHSYLGQNIFQALNLPQPIELSRSPSESLSLPKGAYLLAANQKSFALNNILSLLSKPMVEVNYLEQKDANFHALPTSYDDSSYVRRVAEIKNHHYQGVIFDATGLTDFNDLEVIYRFFQMMIPTLDENAKVVLLAQSFVASKDPSIHALNSSLEGFVKSFAKEVGKKGITCNLIYVQKGAQKYLDSSLTFFLSNKSAYISGQSITIKNQGLKQSSSFVEKPLAGKTALVTGAAQGIGRETAIALSRDGAIVICLDIPQNQKALDSLTREIHGHTFAVDLLSDNAVSDVIQKISAQIGVLDIVVHNAGITRDRTLAKMTVEQWNSVLCLNFERVVQLNQAFIEKNIFNEHARIICISSISGIAGNFGQANYACSKSGVAAYVQAFAESTALKNNNGLTINAIAPGFIETQMTKNIPLFTRELGRRMNALSQEGLPLDIAEAVCFFAHPGSHSLNGNLLRVCGLSLLGK